MDLCNGVHRARGCHFGLELAAGGIPGREKEPALADLGDLGRDKGPVLASKRSCKVEDEIGILVELLAEDDGVLGNWVLVRHGDDGAYEDKFECEGAGEGEEVNER